MSAASHSTQMPKSAPASVGQEVSIFVYYNHPLLQLQRALDWEKLQAVMVKHWHAAGKNVAGGPGQPWPVSLYVPLLVLMSVKALNSRQMEEYLCENVVARLFLGLEEQLLPHVRDHSNIARAQDALGAGGWAEVNHLAVTEAVRYGFAQPQILSSDTTVQEPQIGYPNEPSILRQIGQRVSRVMVKLKKRGSQQAAAAIEKTKEIFRQVKDYHLFAKTKTAKDKALRKLLRQTQALMKQSKEVIKEVGEASHQVERTACEKLQAMVEVSRVLIPQIQSWIRTGKVARQKILHPGLTQARAIVKKRAGQKVAFGLKWLINRLRGGYIFGQVVAAHSDERKMPLAALKNYRAVFGQAATPEMEVYDRGGSCLKTVEQLQREGVRKIGIQPAGKAPWYVVEADQQEVQSQRGQTEGSIGTLKSRKYEFNRGRQRSHGTLEAAGQRAMVCMNLVNLMRDIVEAEKQGELAA